MPAKDIFYIMVAVVCSYILIRIIASWGAKILSSVKSLLEHPSPPLLFVFFVFLLCMAYLLIYFLVLLFKGDIIF